MKISVVIAALKGHRFPRSIISRAIWLYHRFALSLRDVEDLLAECGTIVSYETIRKFCPGVDHRDHKGLNNRAEASHKDIRRRETIMGRYKSSKQARIGLAAYDQISALFPLSATA